MGIACCYLLSLECDVPGCSNRWDSPDAEADCQTYVQARNAARKRGWVLPNASWGYDRRYPILCPTCKKGSA